MFTTQTLPARPDALAPDGSQVRLLPALARGSFAHFTLPAGLTSLAVQHRTVEEIWYVTGGAGEMWRRADGREEVVALTPGTCLTIPLGTAFQFRATGAEPLAFVAATMPPWPGPDEAYPVEGRWPASAGLFGTGAPE